MMLRAGRFLFTRFFLYPSAGTGSQRVDDRSDPLRIYFTAGAGQAHRAKSAARICVCAEE
jgi:hypothetical protein